MKFQTLTLNVCAVCSTVAMLVGCAVGSQPTGVPTSNGAPVRLMQRAHNLSPFAFSSARDVSPERTEPGASWMAPEAKREALLYVSNSWTVTVYSYPKGKLVGKLKHFYRPLGECVDQAGDVFIADGSAQVFEYAHGGTKRIATLSMTGYEPVGCAVDPTTGNLAVTWNEGLSQGYVAIYPHGSGTPTLFSNGNMLFTFCGYDPAGNLYVDGQSSKENEFLFAELPKGGSTIENITLNQGFENGGAVQWDGNYVAVGDDEAQKIYRFTVSGSSGTLEDTVVLGNAETVYQFWIEGKKVVGSDDIPRAGLIY
jgi:hypothetical protein